MEKYEYWCVITHEAWDEAVIVGGHTAQEAEDKAEAVVLEESKEQDDEYRDRNFVITNASFRNI